MLIAIGLIAVAAASPAAAQRYSGGNVHFSELYYFWRQLAWIALGVPVMIGISMMPRERARRLSLFGAAFFFVLLVFVPIIGPEVNGARRWIELRPRPSPAVGIPQALLRRRHGLAAEPQGQRQVAAGLSDLGACSPAASPIC